MKRFLVFSGLILFSLILIASNQSNVKNAFVSQNKATVAQPKIVPTLTPSPTLSPTPTITPTPIPAVAPGQNSRNDYYINSDGNQVQSPTYSNTVPDGATAICNDGTYSFSQHRRGTCSHHGGVAQWL